MTTLHPTLPLLLAISFGTHSVLLQLVHLVACQNLLKSQTRIYFLHKHAAFYIRYLFRCLTHGRLVHIVAGKGFFFDPLPWIVVAGAVVLISVLMWIPMVRHITRPLSRITFATEEIARGSFDVALLPIAQTAVERERTSTATIKIDMDSGIHVNASAELLTRALANLVRNAVKYAAGEGVIRVTAERSGDKAVISVRDNGPGVPEHLLDQLFEPFFRPEASRNRDSGGVGLGLAIVKTCVETCGGTISAANLKPQGFAVTITLHASRKT